MLRDSQLNVDVVTVSIGLLQYNKFWQSILMCSPSDLGELLYRHYDALLLQVQLSLNHSTPLDLTTLYRELYTQDIQTFKNINLNDLWKHYTALVSSFMSIFALEVCEETFNLIEVTLTEITYSIGAF